MYIAALFYFATVLYSGELEKNRNFAKLVLVTPRSLSDLNDCSENKRRLTRSRFSRFPSVYAISSSGFALTL